MKIKYVHPEKKQCKAREKHNNANIFDYTQFSRGSVKYYTDALFGVMPECDNIVETMQLMGFLLYEGQADAGWYFLIFIDYFNP